MGIGIGKLSNGGSLALHPFREHGWLSALAAFPAALDVAVMNDRMDERDLGAYPDPSATDEREAQAGEQRPRVGWERLEVTNARIHVAGAREPATEGYATLTNATSSTATVVGLDCPAFERVEMRAAMSVGDVTVMRTMRSLTVLPGDSVELAPGGLRLMLTGPRRALEQDELIGITVVFSSGRRRVVPFRVLPSAASRGRGGR